MADDLISIVGACYRYFPTDRAWLQNLAVTASAALRFGVAAYAFDASDPTRLQISDFATAGTALEEKPTTSAAMSLPPALVARVYLPPAPVTLLSECIGPRALDSDSWARARPAWGALRAGGAFDVIGIRAAEPSGPGCRLSVLLPHSRSLPPRRRSALARLGAHIAAGRRLRQRLDTPGGQVDLRGVDAVLTPTGKLEYRSDEVRERRAERSLLDAVLRRGIALSRAVDDEVALELWEALVDGRWSIVDHVDRDGKRLVLARRNDPDVRDCAALAPRERQVLAYASLGHSNKYIAYQLGLAPTTVASHLAAGMRKLRITARQDLVRWTGPPRGASRPEGR